MGRAGNGRRGDRYRLEPGRRCWMTRRNRRHLARQLHGDDRQHHRTDDAHTQRDEPEGAHPGDTAVPGRSGRSEAGPDGTCSGLAHQTSMGRCIPHRPRPDGPIGFAHRGARAERRENTLEAFSRALELGANGLESDAWITADGQVVLDHDGVVGAALAPPAHRRRYREPLFRPTFRHWPSCTTPSGPTSSCRSMSRTPPPCSRSSRSANQRRGHRPAVALPRGSGPAGRLAAGRRPRPGWCESTSLGRSSDGFETRLRGLAAGRLDAVNLHRREWTPDRVEAVHRAGLWALRRGTPSAAPRSPSYWTAGSTGCTPTTSMC